MASKEKFNCKYNFDYRIVNTTYVFQCRKDGIWKDIDYRRGCKVKVLKIARYLMREFNTPIRVIQVKETAVQTSDYELMEVLEP